MGQSVIDILQEKMKHRHIKVPKLAEITGIPKDRIYKWFQEGTRPKEEDSITLWKWINGDLENLAENKPKTPEYIEQRRNLKNNDNLTMPVFDIGSRLGTVPTYNDNNEALIGELPRNLFPGCNHAEIVRGDSMHPLVRNGALVVCKGFEKSLIINGDLYLIHTINGLNTCKYIHKVKGEPARLKGNDILVYTKVTFP